MPRHYPPEVRREGCGRMLARPADRGSGRLFGNRPRELDHCRHQTLIDPGQRAGVKSFEADPLAAARGVSKSSSPRPR